MQTLFATKQKQVNKIINGAAAGDQIMALKSKTGNIVSDLAAVKEVVRDFFEDFGKPICADAARGYSAASKLGHCTTSRRSDLHS